MMDDKTVVVIAAVVVVVVDVFFSLVPTGSGGRLGGLEGRREEVVVVFRWWWWRRELARAEEDGCGRFSWSGGKNFDWRTCVSCRRASHTPRELMTTASRPLGAITTTRRRRPVQLQTFA